MKQKFLEAGQIVNTHGVHGEVKVSPWCDSPDFLCQFDIVYIDEKPIKVCSAKVHKRNVLLTLEGITNVNAAMRLKNKIIKIDRAQAPLPEGRHFIADLIGLDVLDATTGEKLGVLSDVLTPPAHEIYVVEGDKKEYMIPAVDEFLVETNVEEGYLKVNLIQGMESEADV